MRFPVVTVDGPSGVGKGTVCGHLSNRLGFALLDSGSLYRVTGWRRVSVRLTWAITSPAP